ncbi:MAG: hypothetical protein ACRBFS_03340 [Aureispira sp.]
MRTFFCGLALLFLLGSSQLHAQVDPQWFLHQTAKVGFWYPDNWQLENQEEVVRLQHTTSGLSVTFTLLEDTQMEEALQGLERLVAEQVQNPTWSSAPELIDLNGIMGVGAEVQGNLDGQPIQMGLFLLERPHQVLLVVGLGDQKALKEHQESLDKILQSIKPI